MKLTAEELAALMPSAAGIIAETLPDGDSGASRGDGVESVRRRQIVADLDAAGIGRVWCSAVWKLSRRCVIFRV